MYYIIIDEDHQLPGSDGALRLLCGNSVGSGSYSFRHAHGKVTHLMHWQVFLSTSFFGATGYPLSFVEECRVKWITRNCPSRPAPILLIISKKSCKSSESYKASIIFYLKAFRNKCMKPGDKMTTIFMILYPLAHDFPSTSEPSPVALWARGPWVARQCFYDARGPRGVRRGDGSPLRRGFGPPCTSCGPPETGSHQIPPEMKTRRWYSLLGKKGVINLWRKVTSFMCPFVSVISYSQKKWSHAHHAPSSKQAVLPWGAAPKKKLPQSPGLFWIAQEGRIRLSGNLDGFLKCARRSHSRL